MSHTYLCRLCLNICKDCKSLSCANGQTNEIYEITVKYFHPMFLTVDQDNQNTVMCLECWTHISDFHSYQQFVFETQRKLLEEESHMEFQSSQCADSSAIAGYDKSIKEEEDSISLPDLELMEDFAFDDTAQNDENDDSSNKTACKPEDSDNGGAIDHGIFNAKHEDKDVSTTVEQQIKKIFNSEENICLSGDNSQSDGNQTINTSTIKRKRGSRKSQIDLDSFISQWRENLECIECGAMLATFALLQQHFRQEHPTEQCYITCCKRKFNTRARIEEHARFHKDPNAFKCLRCGSKLSSAPSFYTHSRKCLASAGDCKPDTKGNRIRKSYTKTPIEEIDNFIALYKPNLDCEICNESCTSFTLLKRHFRHKHPGKEFYVMCCQRKFISRSAFKEHVWLHMDPNAFKCNICDNHQSAYKCLQTHMESVHGTPLKVMSLAEIGAEIQRNCDTPLNQYIKLYHLNLLGSKTENKVIQENLNISTNFNPNRSAEKKVPTNTFDEIVSSWKPILECALCDEFCRTYTELEDHFCMKHPQINCYLLCCQQQLNSRRKIEEHILVHREHMRIQQTRKETDNSNVFKCHICSNNYTSLQVLREHLSFQHHSWDSKN